MDKVTHFEIPADNTERAEKFYKETFGWRINKVEGMPYWMVTTCECDEKNTPKEAGAINGGIFERQQKEGPLVIVSVSSIDEHLKKVQDAGGKVILEKQDVGDFGFYARFSDTEGNLLGLWENK